MVSAHCHRGQHAACLFPLLCDCGCGHTSGRTEAKSSSAREARQMPSQLRSGRYPLVTSPQERREEQRIRFALINVLGCKWWEHRDQLEALIADVVYQPENKESWWTLNSILNPQPPQR